MDGVVHVVVHVVFYITKEGMVLKTTELPLNAIITDTLNKMLVEQLSMNQ